MNSGEQDEIQTKNHHARDEIEISSEFFRVHLPGIAGAYPGA
jgi:hypothetical protein